MLCDFRSIGDGVWLCKVCRESTRPGRIYEKAPIRECQGRRHEEPLHPKQVPGNSFPPIHRQMWNLATSLAAFMSDGFKTVDAEEYEARLTICDECEFRRDARCQKCGCNLALKARGRTFKCPEGKWDLAVVLKRLA